MAVSIPRPSFPPPTSALPVLPISKVRKIPPTDSDSLRSPSTSQFSSKLALRTPSKSVKTPIPPSPHHTNSTPNVPTLRSLTNPDQEPSPSDKEIRKVVSIASFPQPPKVGRRLAIDPKSLQSSMDTNQRVSESPINPRISAGILKVRKSRTPTDQSLQFTSSGPPSLLNGSGDGKAISGAAGARGSDGLNSLLSPSQSRSSSAQGSYSTSATTFEDIDENARRAREEAEECRLEKQRQSGSKETKGNVLVSVRVRPDAGSGPKSDGEWMVDGRRSLVAYKGREGGDYYYGMSFMLDLIFFR